MQYSTRRILICAALILNIAPPYALAQTLRPVRDNTIISNELPKADLALDSAFRYIGGQQVNLYHMADAEQHLFIRGGNTGVIDAFYWIQFEHRVPADKHTYNYQLGHNTDLGGLDFAYDQKAWPDYASELLDDPESDGAAISRLLAEKNLKFPQRAARVRMFHLPTPDHRSELMIIYGEALPQDSTVPARKEGVDLIQEAPPFARDLLAHMRSNLTIHPK